MPLIVWIDDPTYRNWPFFTLFSKNYELPLASVLVPGITAGTLSVLTPPSHWKKPFHTPGIVYNSVVCKCAWLRTMTKHWECLSFENAASIRSIYLILPTKGKVMYIWTFVVWAGHSSELNLMTRLPKLPTRGSKTPWSSFQTWDFLLRTSHLLPVLPHSEELGQIRLLKLLSQGLQLGQAELFLKLTAAVTHSSYGPLTSYSSHQTSDRSHSDSNEPTCSQICSINITFTPNPSSCAGFSEKTR